MDKVAMDLQLFADGAAAKAISTYGVTLKWGKTEGSATKVVDIKNFPDLGGEPELIEVTTLSDAMQSFINGIQTAGAMPFTCNYLKSKYLAVKADENTPLYYELAFGTDGSEGVFGWQGEHSVYTTGGEVNAPAEMIITVAPSTKPELIDDDNGL